ncbi:MAG: spore coat associated protein CotJA [Butyrivibrio sp.]|nr:spore coat associated protein CotJA [Butyrivibrio sp.]
MNPYVQRNVQNCTSINSSPCSLAVASVVCQSPQSPMYSLEQAFIAGTIYKELDKPFCAKGGVNR